MSIDIYASPSFVGYSLWLVSSENAFQPFQRVMAEISEKYNGPVFSPHCTLAAGLNHDLETVISKLKVILSGKSTVRLKFERIESSELYFKSAYALIDVSKPLLDLHKECVSAFELTDDCKSFMPHVSLFYGKVDSETKGEMITKIGEILSKLDIDLANFVCEADTVEIWDTNGTVDQWSLKATISLQ
mmetsp:Transcript_2251/g.3207  ORF Transcript_2251/g.3207 Transcript_2251/m.3207 type:complete len:188 (+) Transcript_2251:63-626(+)